VLLAAVVFVALLVPQAEANCLCTPAPSPHSPASTTDRAHTIAACKTVVSSGLLVLRQFEANITAALDQYCDAPPAPLCNAAVNKTLPIVIEFTLHLLNSPAVEGNVTSHMDALCKALPPFFLNNVRQRPIRSTKWSFSSALTCSGLVQCIENTVPKLYHAMVSLVEAVLTAPQLQDALSNDLKLFCEAPPPLLASIVRLPR